MISVCAVCLGRFGGQLELEILEHLLYKQVQNGGTVTM